MKNINSIEAAELSSLAAERRSRGVSRIDFTSREYKLSDKLFRQLVGQAWSEADDAMRRDARDWWLRHKETLSAETRRRLAYAEEAEYAILNARILHYAVDHGLAGSPFHMIALGVAIAWVEREELKNQLEPKAD